LTGTATRPTDPSIGTLIARARTSDRARGAGVERDGPIRVVLADDSYLIREALQEVLGPLDAVDLTGLYADGDALLAAIDAGTDGNDGKAVELPVVEHRPRLIEPCDCSADVEVRGERRTNQRIEHGILELVPPRRVVRRERKRRRIRLT